MPTTRPRLEFDSLHPGLTRSFAENGVACIRGLVDGGGIDHLRKWTEIAINNPSDPTASRTYIRETRLSSRYEGFRHFVLNSRCAEAAATCLGSRQVQLFNDTIFVKEPAAPEPTPWHQDQHAFNLGGRNVCAIWIALDPVTPESGAMTYVPGSHRWGKNFTLYTYEGQLGTDDFDGPPPDIDADPKRYPTVSFILQPGDAVFHHLMTLHKAGPNTTTGMRRRAYSIRFAGDGSYWADRKQSTAKFDTNLKDGDPLVGSDFPVLWRR